MASIAGKRDQYPMRTLNSRYTKAPVCELYGKKWHSAPLRDSSTRLRLEGQAGESAAVRVIFSTYRSNYRASMWRRTIVLLPSFARYGRAVATHACEPFFSL